MAYDVSLVVEQTFSLVAIEHTHRLTYCKH